MTGNPHAAALSLRSLSKRFRTVNALDSVSLEVKPGEFVAVLGPSGSGKTTMLRLLAGFEMPSSGEIWIGGRDVAALPPGERNIGMVFQHYALFPHMNVRRNVEYGLRMHRWSAPKRKHRVDELLAMVHLDAMADRMPSQLSGGQQQRIAIARALSYSPSILLMDEPLGALDRTLRLEMAEEIRRIHRTLGTTFIYVTHDRDEAMTLADRVLIMNGGRIVADDRPETLYERPNSVFVAKFFSGMNVVSNVPHLEIGSASVGITPAAIGFVRPDAAHHAFEALMVDRLFLGEKVQILLSCPALNCELIAHVPTAQSTFTRNQAITVYVTKSSLVPLA